MQSETDSTLNFAKRAKLIENKVTCNTLTANFAPEVQAYIESLSEEHNKVNYSAPQN